MSTPNTPRRGEIWQADLGDGRLTLVLIISTDAIGSLPLRLVVPLRLWEERWEERSEKPVWIQRIDGRWPTQLGKPHAADLLQLRSIEVSRLQKQIGRAPALTMDEIAAALALVVDYNPSSS